jgi:hypothetical protein
MHTMAENSNKNIQVWSILFNTQDEQIKIKAKEWRHIEIHEKHLRWATQSWHQITSILDSLAMNWKTSFEIILKWFSLNLWNPAKYETSLSNDRTSHTRAKNVLPNVRTIFASAIENQNSKLYWSTGSKFVYEELELSSKISSLLTRTFLESQAGRT